MEPSQCRRYAWIIVGLLYLSCGASSNQFDCTGTDVSFHTDTAWIADPAGGSDYYSHLKECVWEIHFSRAGTVTVWFDHFDVEFRYDYLNFYNSTNDMRGYEFSAASLTGHQLPAPFTVEASEGVMTVVWIVDQLVSFSGFNFTYGLQNCSVDCGAHGHCIGEQCRCDIGWTGPTCSEQVCNQCVPGRGNCVGQVCECLEGYTGADCSQDEPWFCTGLEVLTADQGSFTDHLGDDPHAKNAHCMWQVKTGKDVPITMVLTKHQFGMPDRLEIYDGLFSNTSLVSEVSSSWGSFPVLSTTGELFAEFFSNEDAVVYAGFTAQYYSNDLCPNMCSGFGFCVESTCHCNLGRAGADCSGVVTADLIPLETVVTGTVENYAWKFFQHTVKESYSHIYVFPGKLSNRGDPVFFVQHGALPSFYSAHISPWEGRIHLDKPATGTWYFGVFGREGADFSISVEYGTPLNPTISGSGNGGETSQQDSSDASRPASSKGIVIAVVVMLISMAMLGVLALGYFVYRRRKNSFKKLQEEKLGEFHRDENDDDELGEF